VGGVVVLLQAQRLPVDGALDLLALGVELLQLLVVCLPVAGGGFGKLNCSRRRGENQKANFDTDLR